MNFFCLQAGINVLPKVLILKLKMDHKLSPALQYQIALTLVPGIGDRQGKKLISYCGGVEKVFQEKEKLLLKVPGVGSAIAKALKNKSLLQRADEEINFILKKNIKPVFYLEKSYPERLKHCDDSPMLIYTRGNAELNPARVLSIVGTRRPSEYGHYITESMIQGLKEQEVQIVSGLAYGIDTIAHRSALQSGLPTIAVLAHGLDITYPDLNRNLAEKIVGQGVLLTEFPSKTRLNKDFFPRRNRIIAGLADATLVVESAEKGGALITAEIASSYNRDVFAVPGRTSDPRSNGCNYLIFSNKASLVRSADDIRFLMNWQEQEKPLHVQKRLFINLAPEEAKIMELLKERGEAFIDDIYLETGFTASKVASILLKLEFEGLVRSLPGKQYSVNN
jgi:DNA processing protein